MFDMLADSAQHTGTARCHAVQQSLTSSSGSFSPRLVITCRSCSEDTARVSAGLVQESVCCHAEPQMLLCASLLSVAASKADAGVARSVLQPPGRRGKCKHIQLTGQPAVQGL